MNPELRKRILTAVVAGSAFVGLLWWRYESLVALAALLLVGCLWEWVRMWPPLAWLVPGVALIVCGWSAWVWIALPRPDWAPWVAFAPLLLVWTQDTFAYFGGKLLGRHKLWPAVSPGKTWEGMLVGLACTTGVALWLGAYPQWALPASGWLVGPVIGLVAVGGDLLESAAKRKCGVKDSGNLLPGHGGLLDRFDALLPVLLAYALMMGLQQL